MFSHETGSSKVLMISWILSLSLFSRLLESQRAWFSPEVWHHIFYSLLATGEPLSRNPLFPHVKDAVPTKKTLLQIHQFICRSNAIEKSRTMTFSCFIPCETWPIDNFLWVKLIIWGKHVNESSLSGSLNVVHQEAKIGHLCECVFKTFWFKKILKNFGEILSFGKWDWRLKHFVEVLLELSCLLCQLGVPSRPGSCRDF